VDLKSLIDDLAAEQAALESVVAVLPGEAWDRPTHAPGWTVRDQISHLAYFDDAAARAIQQPDAFAAEVATPSDNGDLEAVYLARGRAMKPADVLDWWRRSSAALIAAAREVDTGARLPWYGPSMSAASFLSARLMETWSHGLDVVDVVDVERPDTERLQHIVHIGVRARPFSYQIRGTPMPADPVLVEVTSPSGQRWTYGDAGAQNMIRGSATDFCRVVTQRRHIADTRLQLEGPAAKEWMAIAQAFAGPPGAGRQPGEFSEAASRGSQ
jgi:uncharacterized protein (TIGR03084 family)